MAAEDTPPPPSPEAKLRKRLVHYLKRGSELAAEAEDLNYHDIASALRGLAPALENTLEQMPDSLAVVYDPVANFIGMDAAVSWLSNFGQGYVVALQSRRSESEWVELTKNILSYMTDSKPTASDLTAVLPTTPTR